MNLSQDNVTALTVFDPEASAALMKLRIKSHDRITAEITAELYRAQEYYSASGFRSDLVPARTRLNTFEEYIIDIGLAKRTVYGWLERYIPEENKLLTWEEFIEKKEADRLAKMSKEERDRSMITEYRKTGIKPAGWTDKLDKSVKDTDTAFAKQQERIDKFKQEQNRKPEDEKQQKPLPADADHYYRLGKLTEEMLHNAATATATHTNKRLQWKEKIRLSDGGKEDAFMDAIIDYMETLENDNRRIEACNNIIKICRNISIELQKAKHMSS